MTKNTCAPHSAKGLYTYAIVPATESLILEVSGVDDEHPEVHAVPNDGLSAIVSASPLTDYRGLDRLEAARYLVAHQRVVEAVMEQSPLLPVKFGTVLPDVSWVSRMLDQAGHLLRTTLDTFARLMQMEMVVLWNLAEVFQSIGQEKEIVRLKAQAAAHPLAISEADRVGLGRLVQASLERRRAALCQRMLASMRDITLDIVTNPLMDDSMVVNLALLVARSRQAVLYQRLDELDEEFDGRLNFRCVGPLPPYSFATVEVQLPCFEQVNRARCQLGLAETASPPDIRRAYRRLAAQLHPDHNRQDPYAQTRMTELTQAYRLLSAYAERNAPACAPTDAVGAQCHFDRPMVEQTVLISVKRQEAAA
jgi:hypothetical protein